jgi:hypothetical protein
MPSWFSIVTDLWPIASTITPLILLAGFLWLRTKFPTKEDFDGVKKTVDQLVIDQTKCSAAVESLKEERDDPPTRVELMAQMAGLSGRLSAVEQKSDGIADRVDTANDYLQILIERGLSR